MLRWLSSFLLVSSLALAAACAAPAEDTTNSEAAIVDVPQSGVRDQKETGNCWLFATLAWVESLELGATGSTVHYSPAYLDYWDWYEKITSGKIEGTTTTELKDALDSGGSWGSAVELIAKHGVVASTAIDSTGNDADADRALAALAKVAKALANGELKTAAARADEAKVRAVLDDAFAFAADFPVRQAADIQVRIPRIDGDAVIKTLSDAIGERADGDNPDYRTGAFAFTLHSFDDATATDPTKERDYYRRIQRVLATGTAIPIGWYWADNGDEIETGKFPKVPRKTSGAEDSTSHLSVIDDYEMVNVPGFGTLKAGTVATPEALAAALDETAEVVFFRIKNSFGERTKAKAGVRGYDDLYVPYLEGMLETCPKAGAKSGSTGCTKNRGLEDVVLPTGF